RYQHWRGGQRSGVAAARRIRSAGGRRQRSHPDMTTFRRAAQIALSASSARAGLQDQVHDRAWLGLDRRARARETVVSARRRDDNGPMPNLPRTLSGRGGECATLDGLIESVRGGRSAALVMRGEAGVGKTALLRYATESAVGLRVVRAVGVESEM